MISTPNDETVSIDLMNLSQALSVPCKIIDKGILLVTLASYQNCVVQLIVIPSNTVVNKHSHPDVFKTVQPIFGCATCFRDGQEKLISSELGKVYEIQAGEVHGVKTHGSAFAYISKQLWLNGVIPTSIELNWEGEKL